MVSLRAYGYSGRNLWQHAAGLQMLRIGKPFSPQACSTSPQLNIDILCQSEHHRERKQHSHCAYAQKRRGSAPCGYGSPSHTFHAIAECCIISFCSRRYPGFRDLHQGLRTLLLARSRKFSDGFSSSSIKLRFLP